MKYTKAMIITVSFYILFIQNSFYCVTSTWPSSNYSSLYLLGLFPDAENASKTTELSVHSRAMFKAAILLSQQYNITAAGQYIGWQSAQTGGSAIKALSDTCQSISSLNITGIVGPALSKEAHQISGFAETIGIPVISYSATDPELSDRNTYPNFYRTIPSDNAAALSIAQLFLRYNWTSCIIIHENDAFGSNGVKSITDTLAKYGLLVRDLIVFDTTSLKIKGDWKQSLINSETRIVVVWASPSYTSIIIENAVSADVLGPQFTWILSSSIPLNSFNRTAYSKLIGMITVEPTTGSAFDAPVNTTLLHAAYRLWQQYEPETFPVSAKVNSYALFAFDATWVLIQSLQEFCSTTSSCFSFDESSFCFNRRFIHAQMLLNTITSSEFVGVSGPIRFSSNVTDRVSGAYYYAQNVQLFSNNVSFVPVLKYSDSGTWDEYAGANSIVWPGNSIIPSTDRPKLKGVTLRIGVMESLPFTILTKIADQSGQNRTELTGYIPDLIEHLRAKIGFIPDIRLAPSNVPYSTLVQNVTNGDYDMLVGDITVTSARRELVGFSTVIFDNSLRIIMRKTPATNIELLSYLKPFSRNLWLMLLGVCVLASILFCLLEREKNEALQDRSLISSSAMSLWFSIGTITGYGVDFHVRTAAGRFLSVGFYMLSLVLVASYTANLASDLTILKSTNMIAGIDDLKSGKISSHRIGIRPGAAIEDFYLREISHGSRNYYSLKSRQDAFDSLLAGIIDVSFVDSGSGEYITNNIYCNLTLVGEELDKSVYGIVTPKGWLYAKDLDVNILSLREGGVLAELREKWFQQKICADVVVTSTAMGIESMSGLFLTFAVICALALLSYAWKKRRMLKNGLLIRRCRKIFFLKKSNSLNRTSDQTQNTSCNVAII